MVINNGLTRAKVMLFPEICNPLRLLLYLNGSNKSLYVRKSCLFGSILFVIEPCFRLLVVAIFSNLCDFF